MQAKIESTYVELTFAEQEADMLKQLAILQVSVNELNMAQADMLNVAAGEHEHISSPQGEKNIMWQRLEAVYSYGLINVVRTHKTGA